MTTADFATMLCRLARIRWASGSAFQVIVISPYAKSGYIDHQTLSPDAYLKFFEDVFLPGQRLNPKTDVRPDVRENSPMIGNLMKDFDFSERPQKPLVLPVHPKTALVENSPVEKPTSGTSKRQR